MPIYEYVCTDCGNQFELIRGMKEANTPIDCTHCHSQHTNRKLSRFYAQSGGRVLSGGNGGCVGCSGGTCATCH